MGKLNLKHTLSKHYITRLNARQHRNHVGHGSMSSGVSQGAYGRLHRYSLHLQLILYKLGASGPHSMPVKPAEATIASITALPASLT